VMQGAALLTKTTGQTRHHSDSTSTVSLPPQHASNLCPQYCIFSDCAVDCDRNSPFLTSMTTTSPTRCSSIFQFCALYGVSRILFRLFLHMIQRCNEIKRCARSWEQEQGQRLPPVRDKIHSLPVGEAAVGGGVDDVAHAAHHGVVYGLELRQTLTSKQSRALQLQWSWRKARGGATVQHFRRAHDGGGKGGNVHHSNSGGGAAGHSWGHGQLLNRTSLPV
jgi:hypothetical protein